MKRSEMKRGKPLARGTSTLKQKAPMARTSALKAKPTDPARPKKRRGGPGLKGRTPTAAEQRFMDMAGALPCQACAKDGRENHHVSLHHIEGRTAPGAHFKVLVLCGPHHQQDDTDYLERVSLHGAKKVFTQLYGTERELLVELYALLKFAPPDAA